ncbi:MAG: hypothetical protein KatS3mg063_0262 [Tepidiforma sp.]|uniref:hypothetical protein n=1 Tax=Tepidiforma sp. TaxID=2682230 RepID=UPI0021DC3823|nr:hypothetical protein [Tepidiforma sp.]GIW14409.1 MAG: hypothetical protein KatS3mg063_0262 [Tepidiforma sp.]
MEYPGPAGARNPWLPWFVASVAAFGLSLGALAFVLVEAVTDGSGGTATAQPQPAPAPEPPLRYRGALPAAAAGLGLAPAGPGEPADLAFEPAAPGEGVPVRLFIPAAAPGAGVDALTGEQLAAALRGEAASWAAFGGFDRPIEPAFAGTPAEAQGILAGLGAGPFDLSRFRFFATAEELRAALAFDSGMLAIVPFEGLRPPMVALAIDGMDPARGYGEPARWPLAERVAVRAADAGRPVCAGAGGGGDRRAAAADHEGGGDGGHPDVALHPGGDPGHGGLDEPAPFAGRATSSQRPISRRARSTGRSRTTRSRTAASRRRT